MMLTDIHGVIAGPGADQGDERRAFEALWELYARVGDAHENHGRNHEKTVEARATFHAALKRALSTVQPVAQEAIPAGYALISIDALRAWGKLDEVRDACKYPLAAPLPSQGAKISADLYLQLTDAMGYSSGKDGIEFSPEEWAAALLKDALAYRALASTHPSQEAVAWSLRFDDDPRLNLSTIFDTEGEAKNYAERCGSATPVPLYAAPHQPVSAEAGKGLEEPIAHLCSVQLSRHIVQGVSHAYWLENRERCGAYDVPVYASESVAVSGEVSEDTKRLDWLESKTVNVRTPMRYGSTNLFWAGPSDDDGLPVKSDLRERIDAVLALAKTVK